MWSGREEAPYLAGIRSLSLHIIEGTLGSKRLQPFDEVFVLSPGLGTAIP